MAGTKKTYGVTIMVVVEANDDGKYAPDIVSNLIYTEAYSHPILAIQNTRHTVPVEHDDDHDKWVPTKA